MNKENAHLFLPLVQALADGKTIQEDNDIGLMPPAVYQWRDLKDTVFDRDPDRYRIKPEPRTFDMWMNLPSGVMYPSYSDDQNIGNQWERITVQEVLE